MLLSNKSKFNLIGPDGEEVYKTLLLDSAYMLKSRYSCVEAMS